MLIDPEKDFRKRKAQEEQARIDLAFEACAKTMEGREVLLWILSRCNVCNYLDNDPGQIALHNLGVVLLGKIREAHPASHLSILNDLFSK